jgi:uncharacterized protein DUF397
MNHDDVTTPWRKSSYSNSQANCVEVARTSSGKVAVRDSRNPDGGTLSFIPDEWQAFAVEVRTMTAQSLGASAGADAEGNLLCHHGMIAAAKRPGREARTLKNR